MAWKDSTVPGKGWVELRAAAARLRSEWVLIVADVKVSTNDPLWAAYEGENFYAIQKAIMGRLKTADITRGSVARREVLLRRIAIDRGAGIDGWLDFWAEVLKVDVLKVYRWDIKSHKPKS